jgi:hypothetical protein
VAAAPLAHKGVRGAAATPALDIIKVISVD